MAIEMTNFTKKFRQIEVTIGKCSRTLAFVAGITLIAIVIMVSVDVFKRYVFNEPIPGGVEITQLMMPWAIFLGFTYALLMGTHVQMSLLIERTPKRVSLGLQSFGHLAGLFLTGVLAVGGWLFFWDSFMIKEIMFSTIDLPWYIGKLAMPIGMFIFSLQYLVLLITYLIRLFSKEEVSEVKFDISAPTV